ncbi:MAG: 4-hydroxy-tetrahydrodipicolinate reductase, partial [Clostridia bacterium]|nr:4-hydroxy-tetrahydrodipicolinate reductase [Clostridia bacterium]
DQKRDAPSGTALSLAEIINESIPIHSIRLGNIAGEHSIVFSQGDEILEIRHTALSKKVFAEGAVKAARFIVSAGNGIYDMKSIL